MKRSELFFSFILLPLDYLTLIGSALVVFQIRYLPKIQSIRPIIFDLRFGLYFKLVVLAAILYLVVFAMAGLYRQSGKYKFIDEVSRIFLACSASIAVIMALMFFNRYLFDSRFIILGVWIASIIFIISERAIVRIIQSTLHRYGVGQRRLIVIGENEVARRLVAELKQGSQPAYQLTRHIVKFEPAVLNELTQLAADDKFDEFIFTETNAGKEIISELIQFSLQQHVDFKYATDLLGLSQRNLEVKTLFNMPFTEVRRTPLDGWGRISKRFFDMIMSAIFIILGSPIFVMIAIAIKLDSPGPILFRYRRVGEKGRTFMFLKFRSMVSHAHALRYDKNFVERQNNLRDGSPLMKFENDPRITRVGKFLRRWSLDELPQFFLSLLGTMSLVGPRPHEIEEVNRYQNWQRRVLAVKPGITGLAQISGRADLNFDEEVKLDTFYIENWSLKLDWQIIFKTPLAIMNRTKNY